MYCLLLCDGNVKCPCSLHGKLPRCLANAVFVVYINLRSRKDGGLVWFPSKPKCQCNLPHPGWGIRPRLCYVACDGAKGRDPRVVARTGVARWSWPSHYHARASTARVQSLLRLVYFGPATPWPYAKCSQASSQWSFFQIFLLFLLFLLFGIGIFVLLFGFFRTWALDPLRVVSIPHCSWLGISFYMALNVNSTCCLSGAPDPPMHYVPRRYVKFD